MGHVTWPIRGNFDVTFTVGHHLLKLTLDVMKVPGGGFGDFGPGGGSGISARLLRGGGGSGKMCLHMLILRGVGLVSPGGCSVGWGKHAVTGSGIIMFAFAHKLGSEGLDERGGRVPPEP